jgi:acyl-CoA dehydrogenase
VSDDNEFDDITEGIRAFLRSEVVPRQVRLLESGHSEYGSNGRFSDEVLQAFCEVRMASADAGFYCILAPEAVGGAGLGFEALYRVWEAVFDFCGANYWLGHQAISHWSRGPSHLYLHVDEGFREEVLPDLCSGHRTTCFAMSEPDAGSDVWNMRTTATKVDGGWILNGTKQWSTNAPYARWAITFAVTDREAFNAHKRGLTGFVVDLESEGVLVESAIPMFGHSGGDEGIVSFSNAFVADRQVIGEPGDGLVHAMSGVSSGRLYNSGRAVGLARWAVARALSYAEERRTFGSPLIENQAIAFPLADAAMDIHAAHLMGLETARRLDKGTAFRAEVSMTKTYSTEMAVRAIDHAMQVHGAMGFTNEMYLAQAWQQMRRTCVADGSSEMMRIQIVKALRRDGVQF